MTFEYLLHAAFVADIVLGDKLEPVRIHTLYYLYQYSSTMAGKLWTVLVFILLTPKTVVHRLQKKQSNYLTNSSHYLINCTRCEISALSPAGHTVVPLDLLWMAKLFILKGKDQPGKKMCHGQDPIAFGILPETHTIPSATSSVPQHHTTHRRWYIGNRALFDTLTGRFLTQNVEC